MKIKSGKVYRRNNCVSLRGSHITGGPTVDKHSFLGLNNGLELRTGDVLSVNTYKKQ